MMKMLSLFTKHAVYGHHGRPARRMISVSHYLDKTSQYVTENRNATNLYIWRVFNHLVYL